MFVYVSFKIGPSGTRWRVPATAVIFNAQGTRVAIVGPGNKLHFQQVTLGRDFGTSIDIQAGLNGNETIVKQPTVSLQEGQVVTPLASHRPVWGLARGCDSGSFSAGFASSCRALDCECDGRGLHGGTGLRAAERSSSRLGFKSQPASEAAPPIATEWWQLYRDPVLDQLIATATASNQTLQQAVARVDEARALARVAGSFLYPTISAQPQFLAHALLREP